MDDDFLLAVQLQEQFDSEYAASSFSPSSPHEDGFGGSGKKCKVESGAGGGVFLRSPSPERPMSVVDESWELLDPNPNIRAMFLEFNETFFWGKLGGVEVKWSPRMTLCAGVCSYEGRGGLCSIRLSEPLLKLRPRRDLVETLLHEMIHALLFVTQNNRDREGHGPEFCKHMNRINKSSGTKITIYHTFHDEVDLYRQHWWRCDGPCQNRKPYFGYVKRAMNRAPSSLDPWWGDHQRTCGGTYTKIKEPEGYGKKIHSKKSKMIPQSQPIGSGMPSHTTTGSGLQDIRSVIPFSGKGFRLTETTPASTSSPPHHKAPEPFLKRPLLSPSPSPDKPFSTSKSLHSPVQPGQDTQVNGTSSSLPSIRSGGSRGQKRPTKKSVSNTRVFVNINGSPVRLPKPQRSSSQGAIKPYSNGTGSENTFKGFFRDFNGLMTTESGARGSLSPIFSKTSAANDRKVPLSPDKHDACRQQSSTTSVPSSFSKEQSSHSSLTDYLSVIPTLSKPSPTKPAGGAPASRKRPRDSHGTSRNILDFFQRTEGSDSAVSKDMTKTKGSTSAAGSTPAVRQKTITTTTSSSSPFSSHSSGVHNMASTSVTQMVGCPVCQLQVQESKINEHLDFCLS
ncbi:DNA-dependent metalloprotease SPRTN [Lampris incognitus]|uniref:DNA-dependent metalloprotease SPRTN n=1 Tax=Lampris incognitus TaxID=2546036 RepID=UPI0024B49B1E|nr:DNA-dependent metalloprotease SPRTN [Lampris incognitus]